MVSRPDGWSCWRCGGSWALLTCSGADLCVSDSQDSGSLCFCFRWLLIWFKREFSFEDILLLWEVREDGAGLGVPPPPPAVT